MITFDSPLERCPICKEYVLLDQTQRECAREHHCNGLECPLKPYFEGMRFKTGEHGKRDAET